MYAFQYTYYTQAILVSIPLDTNPELAKGTTHVTRVVGGQTQGELAMTANAAVRFISMANR